MCGIAFMINYHPSKKLSLDFVSDVFGEMESRGTDSSGYYFERKDNTKLIAKCIKAPTTATELFTHIHYDKHTGKEKKYFEQYKLDGSERLILLHTRNKTQGSEYDNNNNMPIFSSNYVLIHNGVIHSSRLPNYKYKGEVDSEEILARVETQGIERGLQEVRGSMAIAFKKFDSNHLYFGRRTTPLDLVYLQKEKILVGISEHKMVNTTPEDDILSKILFAPSVNIVEMPDKMLYKISVTTPKVEYLSSLEVNAGGSWIKSTNGNKWVPRSN